MNDEPCERCHLCIDDLVELHENHSNKLDVCCGPWGLFYCCSGDNCWNERYCCGRDENGETNPFRCANAFLCGLCKGLLIAAVVWPIYCVSMCLACVGYCATDQCCKYENYQKRVVRWRAKQPPTYVADQVEIAVGKDVGSIIHSYMQPGRQQMD